MIVLEESLEVPGVAEEVLRFIADFDHLPSWDPSVVCVTRLQAGSGVAVGTCYRVSLRSLGRTVNVAYRVAELTDGVATLVGKSSGVSAVDVIRVEQQGARVLVRYRAEISLLGLLRPMERVLRPRIEAGGKVAIRNLGQLLVHRDAARRSTFGAPSPGA